MTEAGEVRFRPARRSDCAAIAALFSISSDGVADYIWSGLAGPGEDLMEVGRKRYEREGVAFSYQNCTMAEVDGRVAGFLVAFPMRVDPEAGSETDPVLAPYSRLEEDNSYYVCGVALFPEFRGRGIGTRLMDIAERDARDKDLDKLSLIVFEQNRDAKRLYDRLGYLEKARCEVVPHPRIHHTGDALLMVKQLQRGGRQTRPESSA